MRQPVEVLLGRGAACCLHPWAAWRLRSRAAQWGIAGAYALAAYVVVLVSLVALQIRF